MHMHATTQATLHVWDQVMLQVIEIQLLVLTTNYIFTELFPFMVTTSN